MNQLATLKAELNDNGLSSDEISGCNAPQMPMLPDDNLPQLICDKSPTEIFDAITDIEGLVPYGTLAEEALKRIHRKQQVSSCRAGFPCAYSEYYRSVGVNVQVFPKLSYCGNGKIKDPVTVLKEISRNQKWVGNMSLVVDDMSVNTIFWQAIEEFCETELWYVERDAIYHQDMDLFVPTVSKYHPDWRGTATTRASCIRGDTPNYMDEKDANIIRDTSQRAGLEMARKGMINPDRNPLTHESSLSSTVPITAFDVALFDETNPPMKV